jgi:hypothetical protein
MRPLLLRRSGSRPEEQTTKIVVIGGKARIGSKPIKKLREMREEVLVVSPDTGVNMLTGECLAEALAGGG